MCPSPPQTANAYDVLGELYDEWVVSVEEDIPFYCQVARAAAEDLGRPGDALRIVELGAGSGRISVPLAQAGHHVVAIDSSASQLERLHERARDAGVDGSLEALHGDLLHACELARGTFDLVVSPFRSLLHVAREADRACSAAHALLSSGGYFVFDVFHPSPEGAAEHHDRWMLRRRVREEDGEWAVWERARFDLDAHVLELAVRCDRPGDAAAQRLATMTLHTPPPHAWRASLERAGFEVDAVYGWFDATPFEPGSEDSIWVARRP